MSHFFATLFFVLGSCTKLLAYNASLEPLLKQFFPPDQIQKLVVSKLSGGYSHAANYKITTSESVHYVLRLYQSEEPDQKDIDREFHMFKEASQKGIAPHIYGICQNKKGILTEFIDTVKLSLELIKQPETLKKVAVAIQKVHAIPQHFHTTDSIEEKYEVIFSKLPKTTHTLSAINLIKVNVATLNIMGGLKKNIHNELHPRNVFITQKRILFLDWLDTTWADPFYDLSYFALLHNLNNREEAILLDNYLGHEPTDHEKERYHLTKKINLAGISLVLYKLSLATGKQEGEFGSQKNWSYYVRFFADEKNDLTSQFLYDWSVLALEYAQSL